MVKIRRGQWFSLLHKILQQESTLNHITIDTFSQTNQLELGHLLENVRVYCHNQGYRSRYRATNQRFMFRTYLTRVLARDKLNPYTVDAIMYQFDREFDCF